MTPRPRLALGRARVVPGALADAAEEAARIVDEARRDAEEIRRQARAEGLAAGRAEAGALLAAAARTAAARVAEAERDIAALAIAAAERVLAREIDASPDAVLAAVRHVLGRSRAREQLVLRVHPADCEIVARAPALLEHRDGEAPFEIRGDPAITRGGCVLECELGRIDGRLETQLRALERALVTSLAPVTRDGRVSRVRDGAGEAADGLAEAVSNLEIAAARAALPEGREP